MNYLSVDELLQATQKLVQDHRSLNVALVEHLREIHRRKIYAKLGYASLWEFTTQYLGLSEGAASRRIQAMRLVDQAPIALESLRNGQLSLSNAAAVQSFLQGEARQGRQHLPEDVVRKVLKLSQQDCEAKLLEISPEALPRDQTRIVSEKKHRELRFVVSSEVFEKLEKLRGLMAHQNPGASLSEIVEYSVDIAIDHLKKRKGAGPVADTEKSAPRKEPAATAAAAATEPPSILPRGKRVYLPRQMRRIVWKRGKGQCEYSTAHRRCSSRYGLEIDHIIPLAAGGANSPENLRLLCREHNQYLAVFAGPDPP